MTRLQTIATRQKSTRARDTFFALCLALTAAVSVTTLVSGCQPAPAATISSSR